MTSPVRSASGDPVGADPADVVPEAERHDPASPQATQPPATNGTHVALPAGEPAGISDDTTADEVAGVRGLVELVIGLVLAVMMFQAFVAEAYLVPSGSMAPTLLGFHKAVECPRCGHEFMVGSEEGSVWQPAAVCPNCSQGGIDLDDIPVSGGDRLLVLKNLFDFRPPRRWEPVVFGHPSDPGQAYVKRAIGLPGERVSIVAGDIVIDGELQRKTFEQFATMSSLVHRPTAETAAPHAGFARWASEPASGWQADVLGFRLTEPTAEVAFLRYRHRTSRERLGPVLDEVAYNVSRPFYEARTVTDLWLRVRVDVQAPAETEASLPAVVLTLAHLSGGEWACWFHADGRVELRRGEEVVATGQLGPWAKAPAGEEGVARRRWQAAIDLAFFDQRIACRVDGRRAFWEVDLEGDRLVARDDAIEPVSVGLRQAVGVLEGLELRRDVHYTDRVFGTYHPAGIDEPYEVPAGHYFMLGDNSPISNDSRAWDEPAVAASLLVGRPLLVHLPARTWEAEFLGRRHRFSVPDLARVRRIR